MVIDNPPDSRFYPLLQDSLAGGFDPDRAEAAIAGVLARLETGFELEPCLRLRRYLRLCAAEPAGAALAARAAARLHDMLAAHHARDPSDMNLLYVLALEALERGETGRGRHLLTKVARSGYRAAARARAALHAAGPAG